MNNVYNFNIYIRVTAQKGHIFMFPLVPFIYRSDCIW